MKQIISFHGNILAFVHWAISNIGMPYCLDLSDIDDTVIFHPVIIWHACVCNVIKFLNIWSLYRWEKYYSRESVKLTKKLNMTKVCIILYILNRQVATDSKEFCFSLYLLNKQYVIFLWNIWNKGFIQVIMSLFTCILEWFSSCEYGTHT